MTLVLVAAALLPFVGIVGVLAYDDLGGRWAAQVAAALAAAGWTVVLLDGPVAAMGSLGPDALGAASAAGALVLTAAIVDRTDVGRVGRCLLLLASGAFALLANLRGDGPSPAALAVAVAVSGAVVILAEAGDGWWWPVTGAVATGTVAAAALVDVPGPALVAAALAGAVALVALAALPERPAARLLIPVALLATARATGASESNDWRTGIAIAVAAAAATVAIAGARRRHVAPASVLAIAALACFAATTTIGITRPAALLLAAAATLAATVDHPALAMTAAPGVAALAVALASAQSPESAALAALLAAAGLALAVTRLDPCPPLSVPWPVVPAVVALLVLPTAWSWVGDARLDGYGQGAAVAAAAGALAVVARSAAGTLLATER